MTNTEPKKQRRTKTQMQQARLPKIDTQLRESRDWSEMGMVVRDVMGKALQPVLNDIKSMELASKSSRSELEVIFRDILRSDQDRIAFKKDIKESLKKQKNEFRWLLGIGLIFLALLVVYLKF